MSAEASLQDQLRGSGSLDLTSLLTSFNENPFNRGTQNSILQLFRAVSLEDATQLITRFTTYSAYDELSRRVDSIPPDVARVLGVMVITSYRNQPTFREVALRFFDKASKADDEAGIFWIHTAFEANANGEPQFLKEAMRRIKSLADKGSVKACSMLADIYLNGKHGESRDFKKGKLVLERLERRGELSNRNRIILYTIYRNGALQLPIDLEKARTQLIKAVELDEVKNVTNGVAHSILGRELLLAEIFPKDVARAMECLRVASSHGVAEANFQIAIQYEAGNVDQLELGSSRLISLQWFHKAAEQNHPEAQFKLSVIYQQGPSWCSEIPIKSELALDYLHLASANDYLPAKVDLGIWLSQGRFKTPREPHLAAALLNDVYELNKSDIGSYLAAALLQIDEFDSALAVLEEGCELRSVRCMGMLGALLTDGSEMPIDYEQAALWLRRSAEHGDILSIHNLGIMYLYGHHVEQDIAQALVYFSRSAILGLSRSARPLSDILCQRPRLEYAGSDPQFENSRLVLNTSAKMAYFWQGVAIERGIEGNYTDQRESLRQRINEPSLIEIDLLVSEYCERGPRQLLTDDT